MFSEGNQHVYFIVSQGFGPVDGVQDEVGPCRFQVRHFDDEVAFAIKVDSKGKHFMTELAGEGPPCDGGSFSIGSRVDGLDQPFLKADEMDVLGCSCTVAGGNEGVSLISSVKAVSAL